MRHIFALFLAILMTGCSPQSEDKSRLAPHYKGVDSKAYDLALEYIRLAENNHIKFTKPITLGFTNIPSSGVVGICWYGKNFREIDIDRKQWERSSQIHRENLLFHELTHCLCGRTHDFGDGEEYPDPEIEKAVEFLYEWPFYLKRAGVYSDGCPLSIMYTRVMPERCMATHRTEYLKEMFNRCNPW